MIPEEDGRNPLGKRCRVLGLIYALCIDTSPTYEVKIKDQQHEVKVSWGLVSKLGHSL